MTAANRVVDATELGERVASYDVSRVRGRRIAMIDEADPVAAAVAAIATREAGGIPLIADERWPALYRAELNDLVASAEPGPGIGWATSTSGSSGSPRVILRSESSWSASFPAVTGLLGLTAADVVYLPAPLSASMSLFSAAHARAVGAGLVVSGTPVAAVGNATVMHGTPYALGAVVDAVHGGAPQRIRAALVGGAQLDAGLRARAEALGIRVVSYYGAAELSFAAVDIDGGGLLPFPGVQLRLAHGELWVRSDYVASGYLGPTTGSLRRDSEGWATVGDLAVDRQGPLSFVGRRDGAILTAAATVIPEEVEAALRRIPGVRDAVVFAVPNASVGSLVGVVVERTGSTRAPVGDVRQQARALLAPSHLPRQWFHTSRLERTASGKPARTRIRTDALEGRIERYE